MTVFRGHLLGVGQWVQIEARGEDASNRTVSSASASSASSSTRFKLSVPVIIGIVAVALILIGFGVLIWRWRVRVREVARMNRSYEKYGVGRGIESSNSYSTGGSTSKSSKADPYGSFFEVETEKPKKALLNFRRSSTLTSGSTSHGGHARQGSGWNPPSSWQRQSKTAVPSVPTQPPGLGGNTGKSMASSFSFSLKKSEEKKAPLKPQHLPNSIKSKGISAPLIVANGGPEPLWSPPITTTSNFEQQPQASSLSLLAQPQPPPPASTSTTPSSFPQKLKQPQPRSPPATPGTSQKQDLLAVSKDARRFSNGGAFTSDGSLYSRNSFSSSNHDHSVPPPPPPAATPPPPRVERSDVLPPPAINSNPSNGGSGNSGTVKSQQRNKSGNGSGKGHTANQSSSYTYLKRRESSTTATSGIAGHQGSNSPYHQPTGGYGSQNQSHPHHHSQLPRLMTVIAPFTPTLEDELPLKVGDTVRIIEEYRDAWCLVQLVGRIDSPRGVVPCVCLQERKRIIPVPMNV